MNHAKELNISQALTVCAELTGTQLSDAAFNTILDDLMAYPEDKILAALNRCRRELTGRLTLAAILQRIDTGLPSADEAWGMLVEGLADERKTTVAPEIAMRALSNGAGDLFQAGDKTGARMAFKSAYETLSSDLDTTQEVQWTISRGWCPEDARTAIMDAVRLGRLKKETALQALPYQAGEEREAIETGQVPLRTGRDEARAKLADLSRMLASKKGMLNA